MSNLKIRTSKFRHVYGAQSRRDRCFENIRITRNTHDSDFCAVNPSFLAVVLESSGGGSFAVLDVNRPGRVDVNCPRVCGHAGAIMDVKWNPFHDNIIASASEDNTVKLWTIPPDGISSVLSDWTADLHGHSRKVAYLEWHPTAENVLMSVAFDRKIMIWNVDQAEPITALPLHPDTIHSVSWARDGTVLASTCKDKKIRVLDARSANVAVEMEGHVSPKASKCVFVNERSIFTTGFSRSSNRQYALWDVAAPETSDHIVLHCPVTKLEGGYETILRAEEDFRSWVDEIHLERKPSEPECLQDLDCSSGIVLPYFDQDTNMVYMAGKGDGMIRYVEIRSDPAEVFFLSFFQSPLPQRGLGMMPKRGVDTSKNELARFYKLHASKNLVEPIPMIAPRKAEGFQHDIYPPTSSNLASLSADEWTSGVNRGPILLNLEDGSIIDKPRTSISSAVQSQIGNLSKVPEITTYKAISKSVPASTFLNHQPDYSTQAPPPTALRTSPDGLQSSPETNESAGYNAMDRNHSSTTESVPSSIKNIRRLSMNFENKDSQPKSPYPQSHSPPSSSSSISSAQSMTSLRSGPHHPQSSSSPLTYSAKTTSCTVLNGIQNEMPTVSHHSDSLAESSPPTITTTTTNDSSSHHSPPPSPPRSPPPMRSTSPSLASLSSGHVSALKLVLGAPLPPINAAPSANAIHVRKVWSPPASPAARHPLSGTAPANDSELKKAYFRQLGEIKSLQEQLLIKDKRIKDLEAELSLVMAKGAVPNAGESNC